jgi:NADH-quinone oxidoreductase subunit E
MSWKALDRIRPAPDDSDVPLLDEATKEKIRQFFPRYPTKLAALLPALHVVQDRYGYISNRAVRDVAEVLELPPAQVLSTLTFYTHYWRHRKGRKLIMLCRSLSCELMGSVEVAQAIKERLNIDEHGTTEDGSYSFVTEECLGACEYAPCMLINEKLHKCVQPQQVGAILADPECDRHGLPRSDLFDGPLAKAGGSGTKDDAAVPTNNVMEDELIGTTSDVQEMKEAE